MKCIPIREDKRKPNELVWSEKKIEELYEYILNNFLDSDYEEIDNIMIEITTYIDPQNPEKIHVLFDFNSEHICLW